MSKIADELERLARELDDESSQRMSRSREAITLITAKEFYGQGQGFALSADRLLRRAAELRAQQREKEEALSLPPGDHVA